MYAWVASDSSAGFLGRQVEVVLGVEALTAVVEVIVVVVEELLVLDVDAVVEEVEVELGPGM